MEIPLPNLPTSRIGVQNSFKGRDQIGTPSARLADSNNVLSRHEREEVESPEAANRQVSYAHGRLAFLVCISLIIAPPGIRSRPSLLADSLCVSVSTVVGPVVATLANARSEQRHRIAASAARSAYDNAMVESWISTIKRVLVYPRSWPTRYQAELAVFDNIEVFYNRLRLYSSLDMRSPLEYEQEVPATVATT